MSDDTASYTSMKDVISLGLKLRCQDFPYSPRMKKKFRREAAQKLRQEMPLEEFIDALEKFMNEFERREFGV